jgi:hypothetical protein
MLRELNEIVHVSALWLPSQKIGAPAGKDVQLQSLRVVDFY